MNLQSFIDQCLTSKQFFIRQFRHFVKILIDFSLCYACRNVQFGNEYDLDVKVNFAPTTVPQKYLESHALTVLVDFQNQ